MAGSFPPKPLLKMEPIGKLSGRCQSPDRLEGDVVGRVAGDKFVEQGRRNGTGQTRHHAHARSVERGLHSSGMMTESK